MLCSDAMTVSVTLSALAVVISKVLFYCSMQHNHFGLFEFLCFIFDVSQ